MKKPTDCTTGNTSGHINTTNIDRQKDRQTDRQRGKQADIQRVKWTGKWAGKYNNQGSDRTSHSKCSTKTGVFKNDAKFAGKHLCQSLLF